MNLECISFFSLRVFEWSYESRLDFVLHLLLVSAVTPALAPVAPALAQPTMPPPPKKAAAVPEKKRRRRRRGGG